MPFYKGQKFTLSHRNKLSIALKGRKLPLETRLKMIESRTGKPSPLKGRTWKHKVPRSEEHKRKIGMNSKGRKMSTESRKKLSLSLLGHPVSIETRKKLSEARLRQKMPFKDTSIEVKIQNLLKENGIEFKTHLPIIGQPDIFIEPNLIIFCDGNHWHNLPGRQEKDKRITQELQSQGYVVIRLWEKEINNSTENCWDKIRGCL